jgi:hypothetical protein
MEFLTALWLPIVVSSIVLFVASAVAWMFMPHHRKDYAKLANEEKFMSQLRDLNAPVGRFMFPYCTHQEASNPEMKRKFKEGPSGTLTILGNVNMGLNMACTFVFFLLANACLAYLCWTALPPGSDASFLRVFRIAATAGILTFTAAAIPNDIWFKRPSCTNIVDGIVYGLILGLIFAALWPVK